MTDTKFLVCVTTHHRYNCGNSAGEWLDLSDYSDANEFADACRALFEDTEADPELLIVDWENVPKALIDSEGGTVHPVFWEYYLPRIKRGYPKEVIDAYFDAYCLQDSDHLRHFEAHYLGKYDSAVDFASELFHACYEIPDFLEYYIDWELVARDLAYDYDIISGDGGRVYVFRID